MQTAIRQASEAARAAGVDRIERLTFVIAEHGHVSPESVEVLFGAMSVGTPAEGAELVVEVRKSRWYCLRCREWIFGVDGTCLSCLETGLLQQTAPELILASIDVPATRS